MRNHLKNESSPYLLQHAENPVDWYPWCEEAFEKAKREDKPVFLSVGYSTCHWCHVMAHESFENEKIAALLNEYYVPIKVDREERPDIDSVYMAVCQALTGSGGWPMSIFMTPEQKPFYAGTYFPPDSRYGMPGFGELLAVIAEHWKSKREMMLESAEEILARVRSKEASILEKDALGSGQAAEAGAGDLERQGKLHAEDFKQQEILGAGLPEQAAALFAEMFDSENGGFGRAPKFPTPHNLLFLTLYAKLKKDTVAMEQVRLTLRKMRRGGIFDQIGYGFSRYSTDERFLVPHFEKMLYDNALLILAYAAAYKASTGFPGEKEFLETAEQTADYILREMTGEQGQFYSAQDADSEGEEGKFYVWDYDEIIAFLGETQGRRFCAQYGITREGNFEGKNIPNLLHTEGNGAPYEEERKKLYAYRKERGSLHLDDKILTSWNALMIGAMAVLFRVTGKEEYLKAAEQAAAFIEAELSKGKLLYVSFREKTHSEYGFLDDYAFYGMALLLLYNVTEEKAYLNRAEQILGEAGEQFADVQGGGYFLYGRKHESLITRPKETYDGAIPSGNAVMAYCLVRLWEMTGKENYRELAEMQLAFLARAAEDYPAAHSMFLLALLRYQYPAEKITVVLGKGDTREKVLPKLPLWAEVHFLSEETAEYRRKEGETTYYVCKDYMCLPPVNDIRIVQK